MKFLAFAAFALVATASAVDVAPETSALSEPARADSASRGLRYSPEMVALEVEAATTIAGAKVLTFIRKLTKPAEMRTFGHKFWRALKKQAGGYHGMSEWEELEEAAEKVKGEFMEKAGFKKFYKKFMSNGEDLF